MSHTIGVIIASAVAAFTALVVFHALAGSQTLSCQAPFSGSYTNQQATLICPTPTGTLIPTPTPTPIPEHPNHWHPPTTHEHGDEEPQWVKNFIVSRPDVFVGQSRVIYGGNERSSPAENTMKHEVFKGVVIQSDAGGQYYCRYHAGSTPMDRSSAFHSFECYYQDTGGGVSFVEGLCDVGDPANPQARFIRKFGDSPVRPVILVVDEETKAMGIDTEQWYANCSGVQLSIAMQPVTFYGGIEEIATAHDRSTWRLTGALGLPRGFEVFGWFGGAPEGTYCMTAWGTTGPCDPEHIHRWIISPTVHLDVDPDAGWIRTQLLGQVYPCPNCVVPN